MKYFLFIFLLCSCGKDMEEGSNEIIDTVYSVPRKNVLSCSQQGVEIFCVDERVTCRMNTSTNLGSYEIRDE